jgi:hypothetical protein
MPQNTRVSDLHLEQYALGELSPEDAALVRAALERDPELRRRLADLAVSDRQILSDYPAERIVPAIQERARGARAGWGPVARRGAWALPVAAALVIALVVAVPRSETRIKGLTPQLSVFMQAAAGAVELSPGSSAGQGARIQLSYTAAGAGYGAIFSIDGRGTITWHLPAGYAGGDTASPALEKQGRSVLPRSYELDDAPRFERFFFVYGPAAFGLADVQRAAQALAAGPSADTAAPVLPRGVSAVSFLLRKNGG